MCTLVVEIVAGLDAEGKQRWGVDDRLFYDFGTWNRFYSTLQPSATAWPRARPCAHICTKALCSPALHVV